MKPPTVGHEFLWHDGVHECVVTAVHSDRVEIECGFTSITIPISEWPDVRWLGRQR